MIHRQENKQKRIEEVIEIVKKIEDTEIQKFIFSGLLVACDKFISKENARKIRSEFSMTKVGRLIYEDGIKDGIEEGRMAEKIQIVEKLLEKKVNVDMITEITDMPKEEVEKIQQNLMAMV